MHFLFALSVLCIVVLLVSDCTPAFTVDHYQAGSWQMLSITTGNQGG